MYAELKRLADANGVVTGMRLRDSGFAKFVTALYGANVAYPESFQSRKLQALRNKKWITMNNGTYSLLG